MGKASAVPVAIVRGLDPAWFGDGSVRDLVRNPQEDLFR
jgi:F420-0:gamma-glutamyl ligase